ncbi:hypothetical protein [uncultured Thermanaerothrix sp.]|uniref:hypothetical protein n=1 Tax=uncultured Thermanaerothrix sp. TaxID=1195149 RepID=UPI00260E42B2|nr:hypothetical protein [uncultured Thermanaerothrix sp.]
MSQRVEVILRVQSGRRLPWLVIHQGHVLPITEWGRAWVDWDGEHYLVRLEGQACELWHNTAETAWYLRRVAGPVRPA